MPQAAEFIEDTTERPDVSAEAKTQTKANIYQPQSVLQRLSLVLITPFHKHPPCLRPTEYVMAYRDETLHAVYHHLSKSHKPKQS